jgi:hypothetical protein
VHRYKQEIRERCMKKDLDMTKPLRDQNMKNREAALERWKGTEEDFENWEQMMVKKFSPLAMALAPQYPPVHFEMGALANEALNLPRLVPGCVF